MCRGVPPAQAAALISSAGLSSCLGRVGAGLAVDRGLHPLTLTLAATAAAALQVKSKHKIQFNQTFTIQSRGTVNNCLARLKMEILVLVFY